MIPLLYPFSFVLLLVFCWVADGALPEDGRCSVLVAAPFTLGGHEIPFYTGARRNNLGFSHMAAALLAAKHFNERDASVVPELAQLGDCDVQLDLNHSKVVDTGVMGQFGLNGMQDWIQDRGAPCAVAGPSFGTATKVLSVLSTSVQIPIVATGGMDFDLLFNFSHPFLSTTSPSLLVLPGVVGSYLMKEGRNDFIAIVHSLAPTSTQIAQLTMRLLRSWGVRAVPIGFAPTGLQASNQLFEAENDITAALNEVKALGFRTIVVISVEPFTLEPMYPEMAQAAETFGLNTHEYVWAFFPGPSLSHFENPALDRNPLIGKLFSGAALVKPVEKFALKGVDDLFMQAWRAQGASFLRLLESFNPIMDGGPGRYNASENYFTTIDPEHGAGYLYDAVISIGIGACRVRQFSNGTSVNGFVHMRGIQSSQFSGASGPIGFKRQFIEPGIYTGASSRFAVFNLLPADGSSERFRITDTLDAPSNTEIVEQFAGAEWQSVADFVYAGGKRTPPLLLRDIPDQNYLSQNVRITGLVLFAISATLIVLSAGWIIFYRTHDELRKAQPVLLLAVCVGAFMESLPIVFYSFDEGYGWNTERLTRVCIISPWLLCIGHIVTYGSLFAKLWRVNRVLQFARVRSITISQVVWPMRIFLFISVVLLTCWTIISPLAWEREEIDSTGESFGQCAGDKQWMWWGPIVALMLLPTLLTLFMAWKTNDVHESYSETWCIYVLVLVQLQTLVVATPLLVILSGVSTDGRYLGQVLLIWTFPISTMLLIMAPKVTSVYRSKNTSNRTARGDAVNGTRVSGLNFKNPYSGSGDLSVLDAISSSQRKFSSGREQSEQFSMRKLSSDGDTEQFSQRNLSESKLSESKLSEGKLSESKLDLAVPGMSNFSESSE